MPPTWHAFINGERCELLEDRRFAVYHRFPEGTTLFDPSFSPPRLIPLSTEAEDFGVTTRKLLPNAHYFARLADKIAGTTVPAGVAQRFIIVHNVPFQTTAEMLGKFFEQFSQVIEADVLRWPGGAGHTKGRGYVTLNSPEVMQQLLREKIVHFTPFNTYLYLEPSDRNPAQPPPYQPPPHHLGVPLAAAPSYVQPPQVSEVKTVPHYEHRRGPMGGNSELASLYYFVEHLREEDISISIKRNVFWPQDEANAAGYYTALAKGRVFLIFLVTSRVNDPYLFGYARVAQRSMDAVNHAEINIMWLNHGVCLREAELRERLNVNLVLMTDGTPLKPELGQSITELVEMAPKNAPLPAPPPPQRQGGGRSGHHHHLGGNGGHGPQHTSERGGGGNTNGSANNSGGAGRRGGGRQARSHRDPTSLPAVS